MIKIGKIVKKKNKFQVQSQTGKNLGTYDTREEAEKRLRQVEYFKNKNASALRKIAKDLNNINEHDLCEKALLALAATTGSKEVTPHLSLSFIMRELRKTDDDKAREFLTKFKEAFDEAWLNDIEDFEEVALTQTIQDCGLKEGDFSE